LVDGCCFKLCWSVFWLCVAMYKSVILLTHSASRQKLIGQPLQPCHSINEATIFYNTLWNIFIFLTSFSQCLLCSPFAPYPFTTNTTNSMSQSYDQCYCFVLGTSWVQISDQEPAILTVNVCGVFLSSSGKCQSNTTASFTFLSHS
jgi:hypothetical protein